jgi:3-ketosteroid 9alpha-monooxygenase subunit B
MTVGEMVLTETVVIADGLPGDSMALSQTHMSGDAAAPKGDEDGFMPIRIAAVTREAGDTVSLTLDIPPALAERFAYRAGQYVTLRVPIGGRRLSRCYSMSSAPETDAAMRITIRRIDQGRVSGWATETLEVGDVVDVMPPNGRFCLREHDGALLLFGAGVGITPILSLAKAALTRTRRAVTLVYANRDRGSILFAAELDALAQAHRDRFTLIHWLDAERGLVDAPGLRGLGVLVPDADHYICGPAPFMDIVEALALESGADREHVFVERFVSPPDDEAMPEASAAEQAESEVCERLTITLHGKTIELDYRPGETIVESAWRAGVRPPISCLQGACATCMAKLVKGRVEMRVNDVLTPGEIADGYVLTCHGLPVSREVEIIYEE